MNLLMLSGDASVAQGRDGAFSQMLRRFSAYWDRIDILCPRAPGRPRAASMATSTCIPRRDRRRCNRSTSAAAAWNSCASAITPSSRRTTSASSTTAWAPICWGARATSPTSARSITSRAIHARSRGARRFTARSPCATSRGPTGTRRPSASSTGVEVPELLRRLGVPDEKILILPALYLDFGLFRPLPETPKQHDVIFVGRLVTNKGVFTILDALAQVKTTHPDARAALLGAGRWRTHCVNGSRRSGLRPTSRC